MIRSLGPSTNVDSIPSHAGSTCCQTQWFVRDNQTPAASTLEEKQITSDADGANDAKAMLGSKLEVWQGKHCLLTCHFD
jgi:hypothetical protein